MTDPLAAATGRLTAARAMNDQASSLIVDVLGQLAAQFDELDPADAVTKLSARLQMMPVDRATLAASVATYVIRARRDVLSDPVTSGVLSAYDRMRGRLAALGRRHLQAPWWQRLIRRWVAADLVALAEQTYRETRT